MSVSFAINIGHVVKMSVSVHRDRRFESRLHHNVAAMSMAFTPHCFSRLSGEMSAKRVHSREECLLSAVSFPEEIALKKSTYFLNSILDLCCNTLIICHLIRTLVSMYSSSTSMKGWYLLL